MSKRVPANIQCPRCGYTQKMDLYRSIWIEHQENLHLIIADKINIFSCNECGYKERLEFPFLATNVKRGVAVWYEPHPDPQIDNDIELFKKTMGPDSFYAKAPRIGDWEKFKAKLVSMNEAEPVAEHKPPFSPETQRKFRGFLDWIKASGKKEDPLLNSADNLVQFANTIAIATFNPLLDSFPLLRTVKSEDSDFFLTVAGVFIALSRLNNLLLGETREEKLLERVYQRFTRWDSKNAVRALEDCKSFFERNFDALTAEGHEPKFVASDAIGLWIVWNLLGRSPQTDEERKLVRAVGGIITHEFSNWWK